MTGRLTPAELDAMKTPTLAEIAAAVADELERRGLVSRRRSSDLDAANEAPLSREAAERVDRQVLERIHAKRVGSRRRVAR